MVKMVAKGTVQHTEVTREPGTKGPHDRGETKSFTRSPGDSFEVSEDAAKTLEASGAAERYNAEQHGPNAKRQESLSSVPIAENTAPRGPFSGATVAPEPEAVAEVSAGEGGPVATKVADRRK